MKIRITTAKFGTGFLGETFEVPDNIVDGAGDIALSDATSLKPLQSAGGSGYLFAGEFENILESTEVGVIEFPENLEYLVVVKVENPFEVKAVLDGLEDYGIDGSDIAIVSRKKGE